MSNTALLVAACLALGASAGAQQFLEPVLPTPSPPRAIAVLDLDGNSRPDLATANYDVDTVTLMRARPQGGYDPALTIPGGDGPVALAVADMDLDGHDDLLVADSLSSHLAVLLLADAGETVTDWSYPQAGNPLALATGDLDGDGDADVVIVETDLDRVAVRLGLGAAGLGPSLTYGVGQEPSSVRLGDLDADGDLDVVTANWSGQSVSVLLNDGAGAFTPGVTVGMGGLATSLAIADFDGDGQLDVAVGVYSPSSVRLLLGDGAGALLPGPTLALSKAPQGLELAELNGDGWPDLVVPSNYPAGLALLVSAGGGAYQAVQEHMPATAPICAAVADFDDDGRDDVAVEEQAGILLVSGNGQGGLREPLLVPQPAPILRSSVADLNGDGFDDLLGLQQFTGTIVARLADGAGGFGPPIASAVGIGGDLATADFDEDGVLDAAGGGFNSLRVSLGDGAGGFGAPTDVPIADQLAAALSVDLDVDGHMDLVLLTRGEFGNQAWHSLGVMLGDGTGQLGPLQNGITYSGYPTFPTGPKSDALALGDLDGDGDLDVAVDDATNNTIRLYRGNGAGALVSAGSVGISGLVSATDRPLALADVDGDRDLDLLAQTSAGVRMVLGDGTGGFPGAMLLVSAVTGLSVRTADVDTDGDVDLLCDELFLPHFVLLRGDGRGTFLLERYGTTAPSKQAMPARMDGDAWIDVVCVSNAGGSSNSAIVSLNLAASAQWADLGYGLAGTNGAPLLVGTGTLEPGSPGTLKLSNANPNKLAVLFISKQSFPAPFKGGILATVPPLISFMLFTSPAGTINLSWAHWPGGAIGSTWYFQYGVVDSGGPAGAALSNALRATQP
jgi:hypothetical protein